jgi:hypothetical protein
MDTNVQNIKTELIQWLAGIENINTLKKLLAIRKSDDKDTEYKLSESELKSVEEGLNDLKNENVIRHADVKKNYEKWL